MVGDTVREKPLPLGTSLHVSIDTSQRDGLQLNQTPKATPVDVSGVYAYWKAGGQAMVERIIAENLPSTSKTTETAGSQP